MLKIHYKTQQYNKHLFNNAEHYFLLFLVIKYLRMFNMSDLLIELESAEKTYTFSFQYVSVDSAELSSLEIL